MSRKPTPSALFSTFALVALLGATGAAAQNLVLNGGFDQGISSWAPWFPATLAWSPMDANGSASSGSILVTNAVQGGAFVSQGIEQCVTLTGSAKYLMSAKTRIVPGQPTTGHVFVKIDQYDGVNCHGTYLGTLGGLEFANAPALWAAASAVLSVDAAAKSARFVAAVVKDQDTGSYSQQFDDLLLAPSSITTLTIPASASAHGAAGTFFHTDLWLVNMSKHDTQQITATLRCQSGTPCEAVTRTIPLGPRQSRLIKDVVANLFGRPEKAGAIELTFDALLGDVCATSRTYTPALPSPTNGTAIAALEASEARLRTMIPGLASSGGTRTSGFRSNAGVYNPSGRAVDVTLTLHDESAGQLGTLTRTWGPHEAMQINDVYAALGAGSAVSEAAYLIVEATGAVFPYVTVIDNQSGDSVFLTGAGDPQ
jgi:hypothetical protein